MLFVTDVKGAASQVDSLKQFILDNPRSVMKARLFCMGRELKDGCSIKRSCFRGFSRLEMKLPCFTDAPTPIQFMLKADPAILTKRDRACFLQSSCIGRDQCYLCCNSALYNCTIL